MRIHFRFERKYFGAAEPPKKFDTHHCANTGDSGMNLELFRILWAQMDTKFWALARGGAMGYRG